MSGLWRRVDRMLAATGVRQRPKRPLTPEMLEYMTDDEIFSNYSVEEIRAAVGEDAWRLAEEEERADAANTTPIVVRWGKRLNDPPESDRPGGPEGVRDGEHGGTP